MKASFGLWTLCLLAAIISPTTCPSRIANLSAPSTDVVQTNHTAVCIGPFGGCWRGGGYQSPNRLPQGRTYYNNRYYGNYNNRFYGPQYGYF